MQSVPITTNVVSSNLAHGEVYPIQHYVIKFVCEVRQVVGFLTWLLVYENEYASRLRLKAFFFIYYEQVLNNLENTYTLNTHTYICIYPQNLTTCIQNKNNSYNRIKFKI
jgi:hypothetical protein